MRLLNRKQSPASLIDRLAKAFQKRSNVDEKPDFGLSNHGNSSRKTPFFFFFFCRQMLLECMKGCDPIFRGGKLSADPTICRIVVTVPSGCPRTFPLVRKAILPLKHLWMRNVLPTLR